MNSNWKFKLNKSCVSFIEHKPSKSCKLMIDETKLYDSNVHKSSLLRGLNLMCMLSKLLRVFLKH